jgi:hypothetical protein
MSVCSGFSTASFPKVGCWRLRSGSTAAQPPRFCSGTRNEFRRRLVRPRGLWSKFFQNSATREWWGGAGLLRRSRLDSCSGTRNEFRRRLAWPRGLRSKFRMPRHPCWAGSFDFPARSGAELVGELANRRHIEFLHGLPESRDENRQTHVEHRARERIAAWNGRERALAFLKDRSASPSLAHDRRFDLAIVGVDKSHSGDGCECLDSATRITGGKPSLQHRIKSFRLSGPCHLSHSTPACQQSPRPKRDP